MKVFLCLLIFSTLVFSKNMSEIEVKGMHCPLCTTAVKKAIRKLDGIEKVSAKLNTKRVKVIYDEKVGLSEILDAIKTTSYTGVELNTTRFESK